VLEGSNVERRKQGHFSSRAVFTKFEEAGRKKNQGGSRIKAKIRFEGMEKDLRKKTGETQRRLNERKKEHQRNA